MPKMSAADRCKVMGFTLTELSDYTGLARNTLENWNTHRKLALELLIMGYAGKRLNEQKAKIEAQ